MDIIVEIIEKFTLHVNVVCFESLLLKVLEFWQKNIPSFSLTPFHSPLQYQIIFL